MIKILNNYVLVLPDYEHFESIDIGSIKLELNTSFEREVHQPSSGIVIKTPETLNYSNLPEDKESLLFHTEMEIEVGDRVIFGYNIVPNAINHDKCLGTAVYIKYDELYCAIRDDRVIMLNGYVMVEAIEDYNPDIGIIVPDYLQSINHFQRGKVLHIGSPVKKYRMYPELGPDPEGQISKGDEVLFHMQYSIPLQYHMHSFVESKADVYRMQQKDISGIFIEQA